MANNSKFRILGSIKADGKSIIGYMLIDMQTNSVKPFSSIDLKSLMDKIAICNAELQNGEIVGTEGSLNSLPIFDMSGSLIGNQRITILAELVDKNNKRLGFHVMNPRGTVAKLSESDTMMYIDKFGATNAKLVRSPDSSSNAVHVSAMRGSFNKKVFGGKNTNTPKSTTVIDKEIKLLYSDRSKVSRRRLAQKIMHHLIRGGVVDTHLYSRAYNYESGMNSICSFAEKYSNTSMVGDNKKKGSILKNISSHAYLNYVTSRSEYVSLDIDKALCNIIASVSERIRDLKAVYNNTLARYNYYSNSENFTTEAISLQRYNKQHTDIFLPREEFTFYLFIDNILRRSDTLSGVEDIPRDIIEEEVAKQRVYLSCNLRIKREKIKSLTYDLNRLRSCMGLQYIDADKYIERGRLTLIYEYAPKEYTEIVVRNNLYKKLNLALFVCSLGKLVDVVENPRSLSAVYRKPKLEGLKVLADYAEWQCKHCLNSSCDKLDDFNKGEIKRFCSHVYNECKRIKNLQ